MRPGLFLKLFLLQAVILASVTAAIAVPASLLYSRQIHGEKRTQLDNAAAMAANVARARFDGRIDAARLAEEIDLIGYISDARIYVVRYGTQNLQRIAGQLDDETGLGTVAELRAILEGTAVYRRSVRSRSMQTDVVFAGYPLEWNSEIVGAILIYAPIDAVMRQIGRIWGIIAALSGIVLLFGLLVALQISRRIARPIRRMQAAASDLAAGSSGGLVAEPVPIPVESRDEIGRLTKAFNHMQAEIARTEAVRRDFIGHVSHELRTPLTSIRGFIRAMLDGVIPRKDWEEHLRLIGDETERLVRLTTDILELSRLQAGALPLMQERIDLAALAGETAGRMAGLAAEREMALSVSVPESAIAYVDPDRIRQVLVNLIGNAVKFSPAGSRISIRVEADEQEVVLRVADTGSGVPDAELERIFDKFHRADKSGNPGYGGSGLGLHISRLIVEMHRGTISAARAEEGGLEVSVRLPQI